MNLVISLDDLRAYDSRPQKCGDEDRFLCLFCGGDKPRDDVHRSLSVNKNTGAYFCFRCDLKGVAKENWTAREFQPRKARTAAALKSAFSLTTTTTKKPPPQTQLDKYKKILLDAQSRFAHSPAARYLEKRGIKSELAASLGCGYVPKWEHWEKDESENWNLIGTDERVVFPITDKNGELVAIHGRAITDNFLNSNKISKGAKSLGAFQAPHTFARENDTIAVCEGFADALSLIQCGIKAIAVIGKDAPEWLPRELAFRTVLVAGDADAAGDDSAIKLINKLRPLGAKAIRVRPNHGKDWSEILERFGENEIKFQFNEFLPSDNKVADYPAEWKEMATAATVDELDAMLDAIKEREAVLIYEGYAPEQALEAAESKIIKDNW